MALPGWKNKLPANPSTGFSWQSDFPVWPVLEALGEPQFRADSGLIGAGGRLTLRYRATQAPVRTFTLNITVQ